MVPNLNIRIRDITDGTSSTIMVGEVNGKVRDTDGDYRELDSSTTGGAGWFTGGTVPGTPPNLFPPPPPHNYHRSGFNLTTIRYSPGQPSLDSVVPPATLPDGIYSWGCNNPLLSGHVGGAQVLLADGSARFVSNNIDLLTLKRLATRDDGQVVGEW